MLDSVAEQASLSLTWSETREDTFSHDEAHMIVMMTCILHLLQYVSLINIRSQLK